MLDPRFKDLTFNDNRVVDEASKKASYNSNKMQPANSTAKGPKKKQQRTNKKSHKHLLFGGSLKNKQLKALQNQIL